MYEIAALVAVFAAFAQLGTEIYRLNMRMRKLHQDLDQCRETERAERERLISVLAAVQSEKVQYSLGFLTDSEMQQKRQEQEAYKKSFQSSD